MGWSPLRGASNALACSVLLAGATTLAFFTGGYFDSAQVWAGLIAWALVVAGLLLASSPLPRERGGLVAIAGLAGLAVWTLVSFTWAPIAGSAYHAGQRVVLYAGVLIAAAMLLRDPRAQRAAVPALAAGIVIVIGYGLSERLLPGGLHFNRSISADGRLEQPLTYWNAMGELAALGFVLCAALAGEADRPRWLRGAAAGACAPLGMGLYVSFSRGALFALASGLVCLIVLAPRRELLRSLAVTLSAGAAAGIVAAPMRGLTALAGPLSTRELQGAIALASLVAIAAIAAFVQLRIAKREFGSRPPELRLPRGAPAAALAAVCAGLALAIVLGAHEGAGKHLGGGAGRLTTLQSNRYAYWRVALKAFAAEPIRGVGAGGWSVWWLRDRTIGDFAQDAHSLELQTLAELGLIGVALLGTFVGGVVVAAARARVRDPVRAAAPIAGAVTYLAHSPLDWDWQLPAVTIVALVLAGALIALADTS
jgi:hypothetical protein